MSNIKLTLQQAHLAFFCMMQTSCPIDSNVTNLLKTIETSKLAKKNIFLDIWNPYVCTVVKKQI